MSVVRENNPNFGLDPQSQATPPSLGEEDVSSQVNFGVFFNSSCSVFSMKDNPFFRGNWLWFERFQYEKCTVQRISNSSISKGYAKKKKK